MSKAKVSAYRITGAVTASETGIPIEGLIVEAYDRDFFREQSLGRSTTDKAGRFEMRFDRNDFTGPLLRLERAPDVFLRIYDRTGILLSSTKHSVIVDAGRDTRLDVSIPWAVTDTGQRGISYIGGEPVNLALAAQLTSEELLNAYSYLRRRKPQVEKLDLIKRAFPGLAVKREAWDDCGEGRLDSIRFLLKERGDYRLLRETDADDLPVGAVIKWFYTDNIAVKYTTDPAFPDDAVDPATPAADAPFAFTDGTPLGTLRANLADLHPDNTELAPTYVQKVGLVGEYALSRYISPAFSFRDPRNGAARMEYRIRVQDPGIAGQTNVAWSHVEVGPDNTELQNFGTVPHEMFHQVQYRYNGTTTRSGIYGILREGGARLIEDCLNDEPNRYGLQSQQIFNDPAKSLIDFPVGTSTTIRYAAGLFWKYFAEQHSSHTGAADEPAIGIETYRKALEASATVLPADPGVGYDQSVLRTARGEMVWYGRFDEFGYYDAAKTELDSHETTWGNYLIANYLHGTGNPVSDRRFEYKEDEDVITWPASGSLAAVANLAALQAAVAPGDDLVLSQGSSISRTVTGFPAYAAKYYRITPSAGSIPRMLRVTLSTAGGMTDPLIQIMQLGAGSALVDINRSDQPTYSKTINMEGLTSLIVIVASRLTSGDFTVQFDELASDTDVMITRWNTSVGKEYEVDPIGYSWTWVSPDVMVDTDDDLLADTDVYFGVNNKLKVRIRNRGNVAANNIQIEFWYQKATPYLSAAAWIPVQDAALVTQLITGETLAAKGSPGDEKWVTVNWAPVDDGTHHKHWCVKAKITAPGDPNADNKIVLSNFSNVIPDADGDVLKQLIRHIEGAVHHKFDVIPRGPVWNFVQLSEPKGDPMQIAEGVGRRQCRVSNVRPVPTRVSFADYKLVRTANIAWDGSTRGMRPKEQTYYKLDQSTLPPGVDSSQLVTIAHVIDNQVVGGITYRVVSKPQKTLE